MHLKGALHTHTTCSDGELSVREVIQIYESLALILSRSRTMIICCGRTVTMLLKTSKPT